MNTAKPTLSNPFPVHPALDHWAKYRFAKGNAMGLKILTFAYAKTSMGGTEQDSHHLVPKAFFRNGPAWAQAIAHYVPAVPIPRDIHNSLIHTKSKTDERFGLNGWLASRGFNVQKPGHLTDDDLHRVTSACEEYYRQINLPVFAKALQDFEPLMEKARHSAVGPRA